MSLSSKIEKISIAKKGRENEDSSFANEEWNIFGVFDGMSGWNGKQASQTAAEETEKRLVDLIKNSPPIKEDSKEEFLRNIENVMQDVNKAVYNTETDEKTDDGKNRIGTTALIGLIKDKTLFYVGVGDTVLQYLNKNNELIKPTKPEDEFNTNSGFGGNLMINSPQEKKAYKRHFQPSNYLGKDKRIEITQAGYASLEDIKRILLLTDGVDNFVTGKETKQVLLKETETKETLSELVNLAKNPQEVSKLYLKFRFDKVKKAYEAVKSEFKENDDVIKFDKELNEGGYKDQTFINLFEKYKKVKELVLDNVRQELSCSDDMTAILVDVLPHKKEREYRFVVGAGTHVGKKKEGQVGPRNQDYYKINEDKKIYVIADGLLSEGHRASEKTVETLMGNLEDMVNSHYGKISKDNIIQKIKEFIEKINLDIHNESLNDKKKSTYEKAGRGTTLDIILKWGDEFINAHIGDSRVYTLRNGELKRETKDDGPTQRLLDEGKISPEEEYTDINRNILRYIGETKEVKISFNSFKINEIDNILMATDGLTTYVTKNEIRDILIKNEENPQNAVEELIDLANNPKEVIDIWDKHYKTRHAKYKKESEREKQKDKPQTVIDLENMRVDIDYDLVEDYPNLTEDKRKERIRHYIGGNDNITAINLKILHEEKVQKCEQPKVGEIKTTEPETPQALPKQEELKKDEELEKILERKFEEIKKDFDKKIDEKTKGYENKIRTYEEEMNKLKRRISELEKTIDDYTAKVEVKEKEKVVETKPVFQTEDKDTKKRHPGVAYADDLMKSDADKYALSLHFLLNQIEEENDRTTTLYKENIDKLKERLDNGRKYLEKNNETTRENIGLLEKQVARRLDSDLGLIKDGYLKLKGDLPNIDGVGRADEGIRRISGYIDTISVWKKLDIREYKLDTKEYNGVLAQYEEKLNALKGGYVTAIKNISNKNKTV